MPQSSLTPREELIRIQRSLVRRLRSEIFGSLEEPSPELQAYQREYERSCRKGYRRILTRRTFFSRLLAADVVFQGDFHTLMECQLTTLRVLRELYCERDVVLAMETVPILGQRALDGYLAGELTEKAFLEQIDYENTWGFCWDHYRIVLEFARENEIQVYGINAPSVLGQESLKERDRLAAAVIARASVAHPGALVYVVSGDFHVCRGHLPRAVDAELRREGAERRLVVLHQNIDSFYWELARRQKEHRVRFLEMGQDEYCVMNSNPLVKYQSYLHWQLGQEEFHEEGIDGDGWGGGASITDEVGRLVRAITRFLGIRARGLNDFSVYTTKDLDFLEELQGRGDFSRREICEIKRQILNDESYFISRGNIIYLARMSIDHASEEASHYVNNKLSGYVPCPMPQRTDLYSRAIKEALGFLGSKIVNPLRFHHGEAEFRELLSMSPRGTPPGPLVLLAKFVLQHLEAERRFVETGKLPRLRSIYSQAVDLHLGIAHSLGYILGDKLYRGLVQETVTRSEVRRLFYQPLTGRDDAESLYFDLVKRV